MMKKPYSLIFSAFVLMFLPFLSVGQTLPSLPDDPKISKIVLPDGISCYLVENKSITGHADFALVRRGCAAEMSVAMLDSLPRFTRTSPDSFLRSNDIHYGRMGYVIPEGGSSIVHFENVRLRAGENVTDSLLLVFFDMIDSRSNPSDEAVVISGDIDRDAMHRKLRLMSLMIPYGCTAASPEPVSQESSYAADSAAASSAACREVQLRGSGLAEVSVTLDAGEIPERFIGTAVPAVSERMWEEYAHLLGRRIRRRLELSSIPAAYVSMSHSGLSSGEKRDRYRISVLASPEDTGRVAAILDSVVLSAGEIPMEEYLQARDAVDMEWRRKAMKSPVSNKVYVDRCVRSFLYGADLASDAEKYAFFNNRQITDSLGHSLVNNFVSGLLSGVSAPLRQSDDSAGFPASVRMADTLLFPVPAEKCGLRMSRNDQASGGRLWTFANGIRVLYKQLPTDGMMYYSFVLKDGYSSMKDMRDGEGAFMSDMLSLYSVCGMSGRDFREMLEINGITLSAKVGLNTVSLSGTLPSARLSLLMKSLLALTKSRSADSLAAEMYLKGERLRLMTGRGDVQEKMFILDSLMCGDDRYSPFKSAENLHDDLPERAMAFFDYLFSKSDDGYLILVGDMYESDVKKLLQKYMGGFRTIGRRSLRPVVSYQTGTGESTYFVRGNIPGIDMLMTAGVVMNPENYMASLVAAMALSDALAEAVHGSGMYVTVKNRFSVYPEERFSVLISAGYARKEGLPGEIRREKLVMALMRMRLAAAELAKTGVDEEHLALYKSILSDRWASLQSSPEYWLAVVSGRFAGGKDLQSKYQENIDSVDSEAVSEILSLLVGGGRIEYVTKGKK